MQFSHVFVEADQVLDGLCEPQQHAHADGSHTTGQGSCRGRRAEGVIAFGSPAMEGFIAFGVIRFLVECHPRATGLGQPGILRCGHTKGLDGYMVHLPGYERHAGP